MCGIIGAVSPVSNEFVRKAMETIAHRGPDDSGIFSNGLVSLGHQRLSIIELTKKGHQPMYSEDGSLVIIYNGELYNHLELREAYFPKHKFRSTSDTETLLACYQKFGSDAWSLFNGIFAFALYDQPEKKLYLVRDPLGVKPLYYYIKDSNIVFGSEIKSFLSFPNFDKSLDISALMNYLHFLWSPGEQTPFKYVKKLPAGHSLVINVGNTNSLEFSKYYNIPFTGEYSNDSEESLTQQLDDLLDQAVKRQMLSDVPIGFFLSGGLDSSAIVAKAVSHSLSPLKCFTIATDFKKGDIEGFTNDLHYARIVAKHLNVELEEVPVDLDIVEDFDKMIWHLDEPQADAAPLNVLRISGLAREQNRVVLLGGTGGDDLFSGYRRHQALNYENILRAIPNPVGNFAKKLAHNLYSTQPTLRRLKKATRGFGMSTQERILSYYEWTSIEQNKSLFNADYNSRIMLHHPAKILQESLKEIPNEHEWLNKLLFLDLKFFLTDHNLNYTDKMSMARGVETRVPFLDLDLIKFSTTLPVHLKMKGKTTKYLLKKVMERYLPFSVIHRPKTGFAAPVRKWILHEMNDLIAERLSPDRINSRGVFNATEVWKMINLNKTGKIDASYTIWGLLAIDSWLNQFVDS